MSCSNVNVYYQTGGLCDLYGARRTSKRKLSSLFIDGYNMGVRVVRTGNILHWYVELSIKVRFQLCPRIWRELEFGAYPSMVCRYRNSKTVEVLTMQSQEFWTELAKLAACQELRFGMGHEVRKDMWCLVEVSVVTEIITHSYLLRERTKI